MQASRNVDIADKVQALSLRHGSCYYGSCGVMQQTKRLTAGRWTSSHRDPNWPRGVCRSRSEV